MPLPMALATLNGSQKSIGRSWLLTCRCSNTSVTSLTLDQVNFDRALWSHTVCLWSQLMWKHSCMLHRWSIFSRRCYEFNTVSKLADLLRRQAISDNPAIWGSQTSHQSGLIGWFSVVWHTMQVMCVMIYKLGFSQISWAVVCVEPVMLLWFRGCNTQNRQLVTLIFQLTKSAGWSWHHWLGRRKRKVFSYYDHHSMMVPFFCTSVFTPCLQDEFINQD